MEVQFTLTLPGLPFSTPICHVWSRIFLSCFFRCRIFRVPVITLGLSVLSALGDCSWLRDSATLRKLSALLKVAPYVAYGIRFKPTVLEQL